MANIYWWECIKRASEILWLGANWMDSAQDVALEHATLGVASRFVRLLLGKGRASSDRWLLHVCTSRTPKFSRANASDAYAFAMLSHLVVVVRARPRVPQYAAQIERWYALWIARHVRRDSNIPVFAL